MADLYVSDAVGNDSTGDGSSGSPYATLQKAIDTISNGSSGSPSHIYVAHDVFDSPEGTTNRYFGLFDETHAYITVEPWGGQGSESTPIFRYPDVSYAGVVQTFGIRVGGTGANTANNIRVVGIEFDAQHVYDDGTPVSGAGVAFQSGAYDCDVVDCVAHHFPAGGFLGNDGSFWGGYGNDGLLFENCVAYKNGRYLSAGGCGFSCAAPTINGGASNSTRNWLKYINCYSYDNEADNLVDGSGFIFDYCGNWADADEWTYTGLLVMEGCVAYNNWGPGFNITRGNGPDIVVRYNTSVGNGVSPTTNAAANIDYFGYTDAATLQVYGNIFIAPPNNPTSYRTVNNGDTTWEIDWNADYVGGEINVDTETSWHHNVRFANGLTVTWDKTGTGDSTSDPLLTNDAPDATARLSRSWAVLTGSSPVISSQSPSDPTSTADTFETNNTLTIPDVSDDYAGTARLSPPSWGAIEQIASAATDAQAVTATATGTGLF